MSAFQWLTTAPNPRTAATGVDAGQRGWRLHAVKGSEAEGFNAVRWRRAACGLLARHGWGLDCFIETKCQRCLAAQKDSPMTATLLPFPPAPTFPVTPDPVDYERADTHARLILSQAQELLLKLVADAAYHGNEIDGAALARTIKANFADLASDLSGAFERQAEALPEPV